MADLGVARAEPVLPGPARPAHGQHDVGRAAQVEQDAGGWLGIAPLVVARSGTDQPTAGSGSSGSVGAPVWATPWRRTLAYESLIRPLGRTGTGPPASVAW